MSIHAIDANTEAVMQAKIDLAAALKAELVSRIAVFDSGAAVMEYVVAHADSVGPAQISEVMVLINKGCPVKLATPLTDEVQNKTKYDASALAGAPVTACDLARHLTSDVAKKIFAATGIS